LELCFSLQCAVVEIAINGQRIGGGVPNTFWTDRGAETVIRVPPEVLVPDKENVIAVLVSDLSYTGGRSHNRCQLVPQGSEASQALSIHVPRENHVFVGDDPEPSLVFEYTSVGEGTIEVTVATDFHEPVLSRSFAVPDGAGRIVCALGEELGDPGFYECVAILRGTGYVGAVAWIGIAPEALPPPGSRPKNFDAYWSAARAELDTVEPEFRMRREERLSTAARDGYIVEMQSLGGLTIRGYYFVPKKEGTYKTILHVPGYGYGFDDGKPFLGDSPGEVVELALCVRGHGISADVFNPGFGVPGIWGSGICDEQDYAYRAIYMDCVRAVEFLRSRPEVKTDDICVMGGSQGGGLALATAGLCPDWIRACAYFDPFVCDPREHIRIRTMCVKELEGFLHYYENACDFEAAMRLQDLIDTQWFAARITCPVLYATALFDDDVPPRMGFAAYNRIRSAKQYVVYPHDSHLGESDYGAALREFLLRQ